MESSAVKVIEVVAAVELGWITVPVTQVLAVVYAVEASYVVVEYLISHLEWMNVLTASLTLSDRLAS